MGIYFDDFKDSFVPKDHNPSCAGWLLTLYSETLGGLTKPSSNSKAVCLQLHVLRFPCHTQTSQFTSSSYIILESSQLCFSENKWKEMFLSFFVQNNVPFCFKFSLQNDCQCYWYVQVGTLPLTFSEFHQ